MSDRILSIQKFGKILNVLTKANTIRLAEKNPSYCGTHQKKQDSFALLQVPFCGFYPPKNIQAKKNFFCNKIPFFQLLESDLRRRGVLQNGEPRPEGRFEFASALVQEYVKYPVRWWGISQRLCWQHTKKCSEQHTIFQKLFLMDPDLQKNTVRDVFIFKRWLSFS